MDAARTSTLAEVKALSLASITKVLKEKTGIDRKKFFDELTNPSKAGIENLKDFFVTVGMARNIRIDEDWGTQPVYGIGGPTRPFLVPNNYSVSMSIDRLQLDARDNFSYITSPDYWYSKHFQNRVGAADWPMYTYIFIHDREKAAKLGGKSFEAVEIYAMLPRTASKAVSSNDVMLVHSVQMIGFKYQYLDFVGDLLEGKVSNLGADSNVLTYGRTTDSSKPSEFGQARSVDGSKLSSGSNRQNGGFGTNFSTSRGNLG